MNCSAVTSFSFAQIDPANLGSVSRLPPKSDFAPTLALRIVAVSSTNIAGQLAFSRQNTNSGFILFSAPLPWLAEPGRLHIGQRAHAAFTLIGNRPEKLRAQT